MRIIFSTPAQAELAGAALYIESQRPGFGAQFIYDLEATLARAADHPQIGSVLSGDIRKLLIRRFHYSVRYRYIESKQVIHVLRIAHASRNLPADEEERE